MSETERDQKVCPACGKMIVAAAGKCKHCGEWLKGNRSETARANTCRPDSGKVLLVVGLLLAIVGAAVCLYAYYVTPGGSEVGVIGVLALFGGLLLAAVGRAFEQN